MRKFVLPLVALLAVWLLAADSASAGWRRHARHCCYEPCSVSSCSTNACGTSSCERRSRCCQPVVTCCQPASCCQPSGPREHAYHGGDAHQTPVKAPEGKAPELPKAPPPEAAK
jgi:hypothetical protein